MIGFCCLLFASLWAKSKIRKCLKDLYFPKEKLRMASEVNIFGDSRHIWKAVFQNLQPDFFT